MIAAKSNRASRTRDSLVDAGFELMLERSIDAIPIDDLVTKAGVAKGSFFNHFGDKARFKSALADEVRREIEIQITSANEGVRDPLERLAGGMREVAEYALKNRKRTIAMLRMSVGATSSDYPLNEGVRSDIEACVKSNSIRRATSNAGMLYWLGLCVALITHIVEVDLNRAEASLVLKDFIISGLIGLGAEESRAFEISAKSIERFEQNT